MYYNERANIEMRKSFTLLDESFQEEFLSIFAIGLLECLKKNLIDTGRAEQWLFSPVIAYSLKEENFSRQFIDAMQYASELDACKESNYYQNSISSSAELFCDVLKNDTNQFASTSPQKMMVDYQI